MSYLREWKNGKSKFRGKCVSKSKRRHTFLPVRAQVWSCQACVLCMSGSWEWNGGKRTIRESVCRSQSGGTPFHRPGRGAAEPPWDVCSAPTGAETGQGGRSKGAGWEWYTQYRQTAKILRINQSIFSHW